MDDRLEVPSWIAGLQHMHSVRPRLRDHRSYLGWVCPQSRSLAQVLFWVHIQGLSLRSESMMIQCWLEARKRIPKQRRKGFDTFFFLVGWCLWKERNRRIFDMLMTPATRLSVMIQEEAGLRCLAGNRH